MDNEDYYEFAERFVKSINEQIRVHTNTLTNGVDNINRYWEEVGYIKALRKTVDIFVKRKNDAKS